jgi:hypothetical protein
VGNTRWKQIVIVVLEDDGIFSRCGLKIGMKLDRVNELQCSGITVSEVYRALEDAVGTVNIIASAPGLPDVAACRPPRVLTTVTANKQTKATPVGINIWTTPDGQQIVIVYLDNRGIFSGCGLKIGTKLDRVNDLDCSGKTVGEVYRELEDAVGPVTIIASELGLPDAAAHLPDLIAVEKSFKRRKGSSGQNIISPDY